MVIGKCREVSREIFMVGGGGGYAGRSFLGGIYHGGKRNSMKGAQNFLALFKKK